MIRISDVRDVSGGRGVAKSTSGNVRVAKKPAPQQLGAHKEFRTLLQDALLANAAAIHIEPHGNDVSVRYRVDGALRPGRKLTPKLMGELAAYIKELANLDPTEVRVPQDGRFTTAIDEKTVLVRAAVLPVADGEKIVLHVTDQSAMPRDLEKLGYWGHGLAALQSAVESGRGLVIVTGPAGTGKTATMYGLLHLAADPSRNLATVEDTIEHRIPGINQTPVNTKAGMTFDVTLQAVLHQDPNVIMVGEVREPSTAHQAVHAAIAGRLVIAGMHYSDIASAISHLEAMEVEPYLTATALRAVANQRLARRLCPDCREQYKPTAEEFAAACRGCGLNPAGALRHLADLEKTAAKELGGPAKRGMDGRIVTRLWRAKPGGCVTCAQTGYKGRTALCEVIPVSPAIQKLIFSGSPTAAMYNQAISEGLLPLPMDGFVKALLGQTSLDEVLQCCSAA